VGHDVWIGHGALILPGARIGSGAIIGAGAVVAGQVQPFSVVAGNPARVVRMRFSEAEVARLLALGWWDWPLERIRAALPALLAADVAALERG
jgi:virginiamycin A acetyltransferase